MKIVVLAMNNVLLQVILFKKITVEQILQKIRTDLRLSMNGVIASSMRSKGIDFRMIFGVEIPKLKQIAASYKSDKILAEALWEEDVREMKILATMLFPPDKLTKEAADRWVTGIVNQEIREQICKNLFQEVDFSDDLVREWARSDDESVRTTGYWLFARLCIIRSESVHGIDMDELLEDVITDLRGASLFLRQSALNALKFYGRISHGNAEKILSSVVSFKNSDIIPEREMFDQLRFEFGYYS
jgi:3-methyladenine DNA glycosylase AlkD